MRATNAITLNIPNLTAVEIYRLGQNVEVINAPNTLSGEDVLPGFVLDLQKVW